MAVTVKSKVDRQLASLVRTSDFVDVDTGRYTNNGALYTIDLLCCTSTMVYARFSDGKGEGFLTHYQPYHFVEHVAKIKELTNMIRTKPNLKYIVGVLFASKDSKEENPVYESLVNLMRSAMEITCSLICRSFVSPEVLYYERPLNHIIFSPNVAIWATTQHGIHSFKP
ncbi:MAG: hypothetical protein ACHQX1_02995 [Candidatus Micrarchaeales archaeon]